jgi:hypothetical protein
MHASADSFGTARTASCARELTEPLIPRARAVLVYLRPERFGCRALPRAGAKDADVDEDSQSESPARTKLPWTNRRLVPDIAPVRTAGGKAADVVTV